MRRRIRPLRTPPPTPGRAREPPGEWAGLSPGCSPGPRGVGCPIRWTGPSYPSDRRALSHSCSRAPHGQAPPIPFVLASSTETERSCRPDRMRLSRSPSRAPRGMDPPMPGDGRIASFLCSRAPRGMGGPIPVAHAWAAGLLASSSPTGTRSAEGCSRWLAGDSRGLSSCSRAPPKRSRGLPSFSRGPPSCSRRRPGCSRRRPGCSRGLQRSSPEPPRRRGGDRGRGRML